MKEMIYCATGLSDSVNDMQPKDKDWTTSSREAVQSAIVDQTV